MLRRDFEEHPVHWNDQTVGITASFGITDIVSGELDANAIIGRADAALYQAKQGGRNCVRVIEHAADRRAKIPESRSPDNPGLG